MKTFPCYTKSHTLPLNKSIKVLTRIANKSMIFFQIIPFVDRYKHKMDELDKIFWWRD